MRFVFLNLVLRESIPLGTSENEEREIIKIMGESIKVFIHSKFAEEMQIDWIKRVGLCTKFIPSINFESQILLTV